MSGSTHRISRDDAGIIHSNVPSVVVSVDVQPGQQVVAGERVALLEAMKMEMPVTAPFSGTIREVLILSNAQVATGTPLIHMDPAEQGESRESIPRVQFRTSTITEGDPSSRMRRTLTQLKHLMLGSDIHALDSRKLVEDYNAICQFMPPDHPELCFLEDLILRIFVADLAFLTAHPDSEDRAKRIQTLVDCTYPLLNLLMSRFENAAPLVRELILEVLTRRYYRHKKLRGFRTVEIDGRRIAIARENPKDERLFVMAEVRDLTPVCDASGRIAQLPHLERILTEALAAIRQVQLRRASEERLHWNRVFLYVWPPVLWKREELQLIARRLARQTEGLGPRRLLSRSGCPILNPTN